MGTAATPAPQPDTATTASATIFSPDQPSPGLDNSVLEVPENFWILQIALTFTAGLIVGIVCTIYGIASFAGMSRIMPWSAWVGLGILGYGVMGSSFVAAIHGLRSPEPQLEAVSSSEGRATAAGGSA